MENSQDFEKLQKQIENNITEWYPFEENIEYHILRDFSKEKIIELENIARNLKENNRVLILADNKLGVKNICRNSKNENQLFNKKEIEYLLDINGLTFRKFYYPLPDTNLCNVIFTDEHLPDRETISRDIVFYKENEFKENEETAKYKEILNLDENLFKIFANTFFIECSKNEFEDNKIEFVSFSNMRKEEYRIKTIIKGDNVYKQAGNEKAKSHIENIKKNIDILNKMNLKTLDRYEEDCIISSYQRNGKTLDKYIIDLIKNGQKMEAKQIINNLFEELKEKLEIVHTDFNVFDKYNIKYEKQDIENLTFVRYGLWDLIFQNIFYINGNYFFYDQEWIEENLPLEYIIYRIFTYNQELERNIDKNETYNKFNIKDENIHLFVQLDNKLQEETRSELSWKLNNTDFKEEYFKRYIERLEQDREKMSQEFSKLLNEKDSRIKLLEDNMEHTCNLLRQKEQEIELIKNSTSWKITEPLRKLRGHR